MEEGKGREEDWGDLGKEKRKIRKKEGRQRGNRGEWGKEERKLEGERS